MKRWINTDPSFIPFAAQAVGVIASPAAIVVAEFEGITPVALTLFDGFNGASIHAHVWVHTGRRPSRMFWWAIHQYVFGQLKVKNVVGTVPASNLAARRLDEHLGFKQVGQIPGYYPDGDDMILYNLTQQDAPDWMRWFRKEKEDGR